MTINEDPRSSTFDRRYIQGSTHHSQFSVLTASKAWCEIDKLAIKTEHLLRDATVAVVPQEATRLQHLHLVAFKVLQPGFGHGLQQYHFDCVDSRHAAQVISVLLYCTDTMSTELSRHTAATMRPVFIRGHVATESEDRTIRALVREENFISLSVKAGDATIFRGNVYYRGINNPDRATRVVVYLLFSPTLAAHQDREQRIPIMQPLFAPLSEKRRWAIINYHELGMTAQGIALQVGCSMRTVYHWITELQSVKDHPRSGRPRNTVPPLKPEAEAHPYASTPRMLKAKLRLPASRRTIRRRLNDDQLFGRVSRHFFPLSADVVRKLLSFANGYKDWTEEKWMRVLFADEKVFTLGMHGRVWVQRPKGAAWDPKYCHEQESHPKGVNFWGCFSGRGVGGCETFSYSNTGAVMAGIVKYHLVPSADKLFVRRPPEHWWLLWDNSPSHKALECQQALHQKGIDCMELSPYSPDLKPMEHLLADLTRRVEQRYPTTVDELEDALYDEWALTDRDFLPHLAQSMPRRIQAVINNQGHATKY